ncbi:Oidioi.mRNA.OKI2018_I69.chr2.g5449.t1.cds [Oikopleura dioica]|uniref:Oidioi.mRNA.OKI2018_I69.chr2.g5449.t1.cds n=1 Tax=Oikopleura dioica TaxID=34765 RepID=A0ABN7T3Z5_OIKDI|nr:Oidioi.mRNA.OKI2018_I69.chr2.g5449.t1.cds [Oikopleura dioica]
MDAEGPPMDLTMSGDLSIVDGAGGGWASSSMMVAPPQTPSVRRTQDFDEKDMSSDDLETTLQSTKKVRDEYKSFVDDSNDRIVKGLRHCETSENVVFVAEHSIIKDQEWAFEDEIQKMMKRLELLRKRETLEDILKKYPSRREETEKQLNEVNAELDALDDTVAEDPSKTETSLDSTKESTINRTQISYLKIIHYQEPADEVVETTVTIAAQPIFEYDIPQLTRQHVEAIRSKKVEHVKMVSKESQTEPPERKKSEDYSSQTPQLQVKDEKSQAKVLAHEIAMQTTKPKSGVDAPSQTNVQRNTTMELTDSFSQTKEILSSNKTQQTSNLDSGIDSAADHSDIEATPVQKAVIVNRMQQQQNVNAAAPVVQKTMMDMACDPIEWPKSKYDTIETSSSSSSDSESENTKSSKSSKSDKAKKLAKAKVIKDKSKKTKTKSSGTNPEKIKTKDQSTKTKPKVTSSKTIQTEKVKNEKMVNKQVNTLFDSRKIAELKQKAEDLKRENEMLKTAALAQKLKKEERTSSSDEDTKPSKVKIKRVPSKKKTSVEKRPLSTASMKSTDDLSLSSDVDAPPVFIENVEAPPAVQALPVQENLVQSAGPPPPEASEDEGTQLDREKVKNAAILKNMKERENEIDELKENLAKTEAEKKVLEDKFFEIGEAQLQEEALKREIERLTAENEALRKQLEDDDKEERRKNAFLLSQLKEKTEEVDKIQDDFNSNLKGLQDDFEKEKGEKNEIIKQLEKDVQKKDDEIRELQNEVAGFNDDLETERRNKAVLLKKLKDREDELENELNEALKDKDDQIEELEKLNEALIEANKELKDDLDEEDDHKAAKILALKNLADKEKEIEKLNSELAEIKEEKASLENDVEKLFLERKDAKEELAELTTAHKDLMNELQQAADESNDHKLAKLAALKKIKDLEEEKKELQEQIDTYAEQLDAASEMSELDERALADAKHQNKLLNQTLDSVKSSVEDLKNASFQEDKENEEKIQALEAEKEEKVKIIEELEETIKSLEDQIEDLNGESEKSREEKLKTLAKIKLLEEAQTDKENLEDELEKTKANLAALEKQIKDQDEAIQDLEEELNSKSTEVVNLKQKVAELESELAEEQETADGDRAKALIVAKELKDRQDEIDFLKEEIENLKAENAQLAENQESEEDRAKKLLVAKELADRKEDIEKLNQELESLKAENAELAENQETEDGRAKKILIAKELADRKEEIEKLEAANKSLENENAKLESEKQDAEDDRAKKVLIAKELAERKEEIEKLTDELNELKDKNEELEKQAAENEEAKAAKLLIAKELKDRNDEIESLKQALALEEQNALNSADPNRIKELEDEIAALEDQRDQQEAKIKGLEKDLEFSKVLEDEIDKKEKEILAKDEQIQTYERTIAENNRQLKDLLVLKKAADKVSELEKELEEAKTANEGLESNLSALKEERDELKSELEELRNAQDADSSAEDLAKKPLTGSTKTLDSGIFDKTQTLEDIPLGSSTENIPAEPQMIIIRRLQIENERLISERDSVGDVETLKKEYQDEKAHLEEDLDFQQQKINELTGQLEKLLQDKAGLEEDLELKNEDLQAVEDDLSDLKNKLKNSQAENDEIKEENENRLKELVALKALKDRSDDIEDLKKEVEELKGEKEALEKDLEEKYLEALALKKLIENEQEEKAQLNEAYQELEAELREKDAELSQIEEQVKNEKFERAKTLAALKALKKAAESEEPEDSSEEEESDIFPDMNDESQPEEIIDDIKKILVIKKSKEINNPDLENLKDQIADLEDENDELKAQNHKLEEIRQKNKEEIEKLTEENENLHEDVQSRPGSITLAPIVAQEQQVQSSNPFLQTHSDIESSIEQAVSAEPSVDNSNLLKELQDENERLQEEMADLRAQLDLTQTQMKFITAEKSDSGSSSGDLAEENEKLRAEVKRLAALVAMYKGRDSDDEVDLRPAKRVDSVPDLLEADTQKNLKEGVLHELTNTQKKLKDEEEKNKDLERIVEKLNQTISDLQKPEAQQMLKEGALSELEREKKRRSEAEDELAKAKEEAELAKQLKEGALAEVDRLNSSLISSKLEELEKSDSKSSSRQSTPIPSKKLDELELQTMENEVQLQALKPNVSELAKKSPEEQEKALEDLKRNLKEKAEEIDELEKEIEELKDENKELKIEAYDAEKHKKKFKKAVEEKHELGQELEELTTLYDQLLAKNDELKQKLARCRNELELLQEPYDQQLLQNAQNSNRRLSDPLLIRIPAPERTFDGIMARELKNNDEIFVDEEKLAVQRRDPIDDDALWNIKKMKCDMRQLQAQLRELDDRNSKLENKNSRALEQTDILEGHLNRASRDQSDLMNMSISSSNRSLDRINESMTDQLIRNRDEMRVIDDENNRLSYELDQLKREHEETERDLKQARNKLIWQQKELEALRETTAKPNVDDYDKLMTEYTSALDKIEKQEEMLEQASMSSKADDLQSHLDQSRAECELYEEEIGELKSKIKVLEGKLKSSGRRSPDSEIQDMSLGDSLVEKIENLEVKDNWTAEEKLKLEMVNELRYIFSEPEIVREEVSGPSSLESSSSAGKKKKESIDVLKESKETIRLLQSALEKLADESDEHKDVTSELKGLSDQSVRLTDQLKKRQDFIDRLVEKYKSSEEKVRDFIRQTMRAILQREQDRVAQRVSQDESVASMTFDL